MGRVAAQPGDMCYFCGDNAGIIEIKSSTHPYRIAKDKISQLPILHKLDLAGGKSVVLILHSELNLWRAVLPSQLPFGVPSWDLSGFPTYTTAEEALLSTGYFCER